MTDETQTEWKCPKDGTAMKPQGRRSRAWRCPTCKGIFMDTGGDASGTTAVVVADPDERRHEPAGEGRGPAPSATLDQGGFVLASGLGSTPGRATCAGEDSGRNGG